MGATLPLSLLHVCNFRPQLVGEFLGTRFCQCVTELITVVLVSPGVPPEDYYDSSGA